MAPPCPKCLSRGVYPNSWGFNSCTDCGNLWSAESYAYGIDEEGNRLWLDRESEARHKSVIAKAAGRSDGIDPDHLHCFLLGVTSNARAEYETAPWWRPDLRIRYKSIASAYEGVAQAVLERSVLETHREAETLMAKTVLEE